MTIATKNGVPIIQGGKIVTDCGCCGWYCYLPNESVRIDITKHPETSSSIWQERVLTSYSMLNPNGLTQQILDSYRAFAFDRYNETGGGGATSILTSSRVLSKLPNSNAWSGSRSTQNQYNYSFAEFWSASFSVTALSACTNRIHLTNVEMPVLTSDVFRPIPVLEHDFLTSLVCQSSGNVAFKSWGVAGQPRDTFQTKQWTPASFGQHLFTTGIHIRQSFSIGEKFVDAETGTDVVFTVSGEINNRRLAVTVGENPMLDVNGQPIYPSSCAYGPQGEIYTELGTPGFEQLDGTWSATITVRFN